MYWVAGEQGGVYEVRSTNGGTDFVLLTDLEKCYRGGIFIYGVYEKNDVICVRAVSVDDDSFVLDGKTAARLAVSGKLRIENGVLKSLDVNLPSATIYVLATDLNLKMVGRGLRPVCSCMQFLSDGGMNSLGRWPVLYYGILRPDVCLYMDDETNVGFLDDELWRLSLANAYRHLDDVWSIGGCDLIGFKRLRGALCTLDESWLPWFGSAKHWKFDARGLSEHLGDIDINDIVSLYVMAYMKDTPYLTFAEYMCDDTGVTMYVGGEEFVKTLLFVSRVARMKDTYFTCTARLVVRVSEYLAGLGCRVVTRSEYAGFWGLRTDIWNAVKGSCVFENGSFKTIEL